MQVTPSAHFTFELPEALVTLGRYQHADFPIALNRFTANNPKITFSAKGGQIAPKEEGRTRMYAEFAKDKGSIHSKILTNLGKHRVDVTAVGVYVTAEPALLMLEPGATGKLRLNAERMKTFDSAVTIQLSPVLGLTFPDKVVIPRGQAGVDIEVKADPQRTPGRQSINLNASAEVNGFEEEQRGRFDIEIVKTPTPKK